MHHAYVRISITAYEAELIGRMYDHVMSTLGKMEWNTRIAMRAQSAAVHYPYILKICELQFEQSSRTNRKDVMCDVVVELWHLHSMVRLFDEINGQYDGDVQRILSTVDTDIESLSGLFRYLIGRFYDEAGEKADGYTPVLPWHPEDSD